MTVTFPEESTWNVNVIVEDPFGTVTLNTLSPLAGVVSVTPLRKYITGEADLEVAERVVDVLLSHPALVIEHPTVALVADPVTTKDTPLTSWLPSSQFVPEPEARTVKAPPDGFPCVPEGTVTLP